ncbi:MAG: dockerin type I repeat-containing protein [Candidatus Zixiibacteriota bacterium]|nr:MAG: dockerin type I repeat-containing protein [candidate division Zixibacteria bacterium]
MIKIKLLAMIVAVAGLLVGTVHADANRQVRPAKITPKGAPEIKAEAMSIQERTSLAGSRQGYVMVTDVLDAFGGASESDNYGIPVNSGGQPSAIGLSDSDNWGMEAGYVMATRVVRGDLNADGIINVGDVVYLVNYLYRGGDEPCPIEAGDVTDDGIVNVGDVVFLVNYLYRGGDPPPC